MRKAVLVLSLAIIFILAFVGCSQDPEHVHTFSTEWTYDTTHHWHEPTCGHDVVSGKAEHSWDDGTVTKEATHTTDGVMTYTCTVCSATRTETIPAKVDEHTFSTDWTCDATYHWHEATCGHDVISGKAEHSWDDGTVTKEATHTTDGVMTYTCTVCSSTRTEAIPAKADEHTFSTDWTCDATYHWHEATCGHDVISGKAEHSWDDGTVTKEATHTTDGVMTYTCTVCSATRAETIPADPDAHTFSTDWTYDATYHWHEPTCGHDVISGKAEHSWDEGAVTKEATHTTDGVMTYTCTVCSSTRTEAIPAKADEHTFSTDWTYDYTHHWHAATCGHDVVSEKAEHSWDEGTVTTEATYTSEGLMTYTCTVCSATKTEVIPKINDYIGVWEMSGIRLDGSSGILDKYYLVFTSEEYQAINDIQITDSAKAKEYVINERRNYSWGNNYDYALTEDDINAMSDDDLRLVFMKAWYYTSTVPAGDEKPQKYSVAEDGSVTLSVFGGEEKVIIQDNHLVTVPDGTVVHEKTQDSRPFVDALLHDIAIEGIDHTWNDGEIIPDDRQTAEDCRYIILYRCLDCEAIWSSQCRDSHSWDEGTVTTEATHTTDGVMTYNCTVCSMTKTEIIPAKADEHTFSTDWTYDYTHHWHAATCGHDVVSGKAEHNLNTEGICETCAYESNFKVDSNGVLSVIDKSLVKGVVTIPTKIGGIQVTAIGDSAFYECTALTSVTIPSTVTSIGEFAFFGCSSLTEISIPEGVTSIGESAFSECTNLTSVTIPSTVTSIGADAFHGCTCAVVFAEGTTAIPDDALYDASEVTSITIPEGVTTIGSRAFSFCTSIGLKEITIPSTVTSIGEKAFYGCYVSVVFAEGTTAIPDGALSMATKATSVTIPEGVVSIGEKAFYGDYGFREITIPSTVTSIGSYAFYNTSLTEINVPKGVTIIEDGTFDGCHDLKEITIPEGVTSIGYNAFHGCKGLTSVTIPSTVTSIGSYAFSETGLTSITIPEGVTTIDENAFYYCKGLTSVTIPSSVISINNGAFEYCGLKEITIPSSVVTIGADAFSGCQDLTSVTIPSSVTSIGLLAFRSCTSLNELYFQGTELQWTSLSKGADWNKNVPATVVHCSDGDVPL